MLAAWKVNDTHKLAHLHMYMVSSTSSHTAVPKDIAFFYARKIINESIVNRVGGGVSLTLSFATFEHTKHRKNVHDVTEPFRNKMVYFARPFCYKFIWKWVHLKTGAFQMNHNHLRIYIPVYFCRWLLLCFIQYYVVIVCASVDHWITSNNSSSSSIHKKRQSKKAKK